jgi:chemotaxis protein MotB
VSSGGHGHGRKKAAHHEEEEHENHERWLVSYADMVTLLMCLFIVLFAMSQIDKQKFAQLASGLAQSFGTPVTALTDSGSSSDAGILDALPAPVDVENTDPAVKPTDAQVKAAEAKAAVADQQRTQAEAKAAYDQLVAAQQRLQAALQAAGHGDAARFTIDERGLVVHVVADQVLFGAEQADLRPDGRQVLDAVAPTLKSLPNGLRVEGHTNSVPVTRGGPWPSNWELSTYRATTVLRHLSGDGVPEGRLSATGYADTRPLVPDSDPTALSVNRRVDIVVLSTASAEANALLPGLAGTSTPSTQESHP